MISDIEDPLERYYAYIDERNTIFHTKACGEPWPWTKDPILQQYRFTDIYRERDRTSLHYQSVVRDRYTDDALVLPATVLYRWFNRISTCEAIFNDPSYGNPKYGNRSCFEQYVYNDEIEILHNCLRELPPPHVTGAFIITGKPGYSKAEGVFEYFETWMKKPWVETFVNWLHDPPSLSAMNAWLMSEGLGSFLTAQLVADLKYLPFMRGVEDWWTWAAPGPGSMRGMNVLLDRPMNQSWNKNEWIDEIQKLRQMENEHFKNHLTIQPFHAQDTQNHLCEFSKYTKVMTDKGRPRQRYHHV